MEKEGYAFNDDRWFRAWWKIAAIASNRQHLSPPLILLCAEQLHIILVKEKKKKKKKKRSFRFAIILEIPEPNFTFIESDYRIS